MKRSPIVRDPDPFVVSLEENLSHHLWSISTLLGMSKDDIIAEALEDWIECRTIEFAWPPKGPAAT